MDAFYVSVELMRRPELRGRPVVVAGSGPRAVVTTASYEARRYGVFSAIPAARARRLCPEATFIAPDLEAYRAMSKRVMDRVRAQVETVEVIGLDEAYLDLTGLVLAARGDAPPDLRDQGRHRAARLRRDRPEPAGGQGRLRRREARRASSCSRASRRASASPTRPPRLLPGIGAKTAERLEELGIATIARLAATPPETLTERFGGRLGPLPARAGALRGRHAGLQRADRGLGVARDDVPHRRRRPRRAGRRAAPARRRSLCEGLAKHERRGRTIAIKVRLDDFTTVTRARTLPAATNDPAVVSDVACALLDEYAPPRPVRLLGVRVAAFEEDAPLVETPQMTLALET